MRSIGQLSLREITFAMKAKPKGHLVAKVTVLLFPGALSNLDNLCNATQSPSWSGNKVWEAECPFHSEDSTGHMGVPHLTHHHPRESLCPTYHRQRPPAHASLEAHVKASTMAVHWVKIIKDPTSLMMRPPPTTWPTTRRPEAEPGKCFITPELFFTSFPPMLQIRNFYFRNRDTDPDSSQRSFRDPALDPEGLGISWSRSRFRSKPDR